MSDEQNETPKPPAKPTAKTSTVPLKKETVRITLRAKPGTGVTQPKADTAPAPTAAVTPPPAAAAPAAPAPPAPPKPATGAPAPPKPAVTQPLEQTQKVNPKMQSTQKVTVKAAPAVPRGAAPTPAKTVPLTAAPTTSTPGAAAGTQQLPKATVKLQQTQTLEASPSAGEPSGSIGTDSQLLLDEEDRSRGLMPLAVIACLGSLAAMALALSTSDKVGISLPKANNPSWEKSPDNGTTWSSSFSLDPVPVYDGVDKDMEVIMPESSEDPASAEETPAEDTGAAEADVLEETAESVEEAAAE